MRTTVPALRGWVVWVGWLALGCGDPAAVDVPSFAPETREPSSAFAASGACAECHAREHSLWLGSHHDRAMEPANADSVLGDFENREFEQFGVTTRFHRSQDGYRVETEGPDGQVRDFEVVYTFGFEPLQQYLVALPGGRLQSLTVAWDSDRGAWFSLYPDEPIAPGDPLHWSGRQQRWNSMCADCHSTGLRRGYDLASDTYAPSWAELDVGCQACHGAGAAHVAWARDPARLGGSADDGLRVRFDASAPQREIEVCAPCHSRRHAISDRADVGAGIGEPFLDHYSPALLHPALYHADGQVKAEVYVYGSFLQSRMYGAGVRCGDCHEPHGLKLRAEGNALCTQCHSERANPRFPSLAARAYDTPEHHFHPAGSAGARCVECHMPAQTFMQVDPRRDHSLRIPRPDLSLALGTPNACTGCHADRDAAWAEAALAARRPPGAPAPTHYGEALSAGWAGAPDSAPRVAALAVDSEVPGIVRATAAMLLPTIPGAGLDPLPTLIEASSDADPLVRASAARALELRPTPESLAALVGLLEDPRRAVRIEAARVLAVAPAERFSVSERDALGAALAEFRAAQNALADTPAAHLNLGILHARRGRPGEAEAAYRTALRLAPDFVPARVNLANLYNTQSRNDEAERELRSALEYTERFPVPSDGPDPRGELYYSLGLLLAETGRLDAAERELARAAEVLPARSRIHYNHGLALQQLGRVGEAEKALLEAEALAPDSPDMQNALAILNLQAGRPARALPHAERLVALTGSESARALLGEVRRRLEAAPDAAPSEESLR